MNSRVCAFVASLDPNSHENAPLMLLSMALPSERICLDHLVTASLGSTGGTKALPTDEACTWCTDGLHPHALTMNTVH